jgi:hypothetical protein
VNARQSKEPERRFEHMHDNPCMPFNLDARPGIHDAVSELYADYWERNPGSTRESAREFYRIAYESLIPSFPSYRETIARKGTN